MSDVKKVLAEGIRERTALKARITELEEQAAEDADTIIQLTKKYVGAADRINALEAERERWKEEASHQERHYNMLVKKICELAAPMGKQVDSSYDTEGGEYDILRDAVACLSKHKEFVQKLAGKLDGDSYTDYLAALKMIKEEQEAIDNAMEQG